MFLAAACLVAAAPAADEILNLPGWSGPLPSRWWSGLIDAGSEGGYTMHEHYVYIEAESQPETAPIVLWTNGGPGASSLFGLFVELGPFYMDDASLTTDDYNRTGVPTLFYNPYTWTKLANLLIINSPPPVGFSYCDPIGPTGGGTSCGSWNDTKTAVHNKIFLDNFVRKFPELGGPNRQWFLTGESYAGIYVPMLANLVLDDPAPLINLKGFAIGDGCVGTEVLCGNQGPYFFIEFFHGHIQFSDKLYRKIQRDCPLNQLITGPVTDPTCQAHLNEMNNQIGGYYAYNLYDECTYENLGKEQSSATSVSASNKLLALWQQSKMQWDQSKRNYWGPAPFSSRMAHRRTAKRNLSNPGYPCGGDFALNIWTNSTLVREALHVALDSNFFSGDNGAGFVYNYTEKNLLPFYRALANGYKGQMEEPIRVLIYNGDTDPCINAMNAQNWTSSMGFDELEAWRPWTLDDKQRMGGYVTRYNTTGAFDFLTIRGSGHMVPEYQPESAFIMLKNWLQNVDWPTYKA